MAVTEGRVRAAGLSPALWGGPDSNAEPAVALVGRVWEHLLHKITAAGSRAVRWRQRITRLPTLGGSVSWQPGSCSQTLGRRKRWLLEFVVKNQLIEKTAEWVLGHRPGSLDAAVTLVDNQLLRWMEDPGWIQSSVGNLPVPAPRRRILGSPPAPPTVAPHRNSLLTCSPLLPLCRSWELQALDPSHRKSHRRQGRSAGAGIHTERPLMEVGQVFRVTGLPAPSPGLGVTYNVPVRHQRAVHQAMVDSGCMQTLVYQTLV